MGTSAFEILIVPVFLATLASCVAGAVILALMKVIESLVDKTVRGPRSSETPPRAASDPRRRVERPTSRTVGSIG